MMNVAESSVLVDIRAAWDQHERRREKQMATDEVLNRAIDMIRTGRKAEAQRLLQPYIAANPRHVGAWLWDARTRLTVRSRIDVLERCLFYNPESQDAREALAALYTQITRRTE